MSAQGNALGLCTESLGALASEQVGLDLLGNETVSRTWVDRAARKVTQATDVPDSTLDAAQTSINGLVLTNATATGVVATYAYDDLGRPVETRTDSDGGARSVKQTTQYNALGQVAWTEDAANHRTAFAYDAAGRQSAVTNALGQVTQTAYDPEGRILATWGATYPVAYEYDVFGRMTAMTTTRDSAHESVNLLTLLPIGVALSDTSNASYPSRLDTTRWLHDEATGLLIQKLYADGKGPSYDYYADGRLKTRAWAREVPHGQGGTEPLVATYSYDGLGQLTGVNYSDATPDLAYTYDRMGRQTSVTDAMGTRAFAYDAETLQLESETIPLFDPHKTVTLTHLADSLGRPAGMYLGDEQSPDYRVDYGYEAGGRLGTVSYGDHVFTNHYRPGANLHAGVSVTDPVNGREYAFVRSYEPYRDLIASVSNTMDSVVISRFAYANDALGRRTAREDSGREFSGAIPNAFGYNVRSELIAADMGADRYGYEYDPIGNRLSATNNTAVTTYAANALNQYAAISAHSNDPVHDDDGNMTDDGANLRMVWNNENRMTCVTNGQTIVVSVYDYMGRRVKKEVYEGSTKTAERVYVYDRWNVIQELDMTGETPSVARAYVWGLDLSGSLQGAGGVGGLLAVDDGASVCYATYDANGNVSEYLNSATGATAAHYEYDGFGNLTAATGSATAFPHRFSTKYTDDESGLVYYGLRFNSPALGRWLSRDPLEEIGGANLYSYIQNNSINLFDMLGLASFDEFLALYNALTEARDAATSGGCAELATKLDDAINKLLISRKFTKEVLDAIKDASGKIKDVVDKVGNGAGIIIFLSDVFEIDVSILKPDEVKALSDKSGKLLAVLNKAAKVGSAISSNDALEIFLTVADMFGDKYIPGAGSLFSFYADAYKASKKAIDDFVFKPLFLDRLGNIKMFCEDNCCSAELTWNTIKGAF